ncbi:metallophosphoesterase [Candidatus Woesearchaeota archaeon]|nr:metallophosphoesterase [Candidatus Woesearchaeota archaeon]
MDLDAKKRNFVELLLERNILIEPDFLEKLNEEKDPAKISEIINVKLRGQKTEAEENSKETAEKATLYSKDESKDGKVKVLFSYSSQPKKNTAQDFINLFNYRYNSIKKILQQRVQLESVISISKLKMKSQKDQASVIGMVYGKEETKNGVMLTIEDPTGTIKVFFSKNKQELFMRAGDIVMDEVIGISGSLGKNIIFANDLFFPEIPVTKEAKKSPIEEYAVVAPDWHVGSKQFLEDELLKFINWLNGSAGNEKQREVASKVKYLFLAGDLVDGISNHPTQRKDLSLFTFKEQYKKASEYVKMIREDIKIIICPGNHDIVHLAEPQPPLPKEYCPDLYDLPNVILVSNPAVVNIGETENFPGFDVLIYHGYSYNYYADKIESIRIKKPTVSDRVDLVMRLLLQKRHLAPTYDANPHLITEQDHMIIDRIPDIFISGDVHKSGVFLYKNVITGIIGSCFQSKTDFQEKVGHTPDPGRIPLINLKTREVKILNFASQEEKQ